MTDQARGRVVFRDRDAKSRPAVGVDDGGIRLPLGPLRIEQLGLDDLGFPGVRSCFAIAHQLGGCGDLHLGIPFRHLIEILADETSEHRRDEALEPGSLFVDRGLILVGRRFNRIHHYAQQPTLTRVAIGR